MKTYVIFLYSTLFFLLASCQVENDLLSEDINSNPPTVDVYVAGAENNIACYWKNGIKTDLIAGDSIVGNKIIVDNNNVYVFGKHIGASKFYLWKNNIKHDVRNYLNIPQSSLIGLFEFNFRDNTEVFGGYVRDINSNYFEMCYWKNGSKTILQNNYTYTYPVSVDYYGGNVYFSTTSDYPNDGYYVNSVFHPITGENMQNFAKTNNGTYFLFFNNQGNFGKFNYYNTTNNNIDYSSQTPVIPNPIQIEANIISDSATNDIYLFTNIVANKYFKNGAEIPFNDPNYTSITDMKVKNSDVYMIRCQFNPNSATAFGYKVFFNNIETQYINGGTGSFNSIFVVQN